MLYGDIPSRHGIEKTNIHFLGMLCYNHN